MTRSPQLMMRYPIDLPTAYDMGIIRERVATKGHLLDDRAGLSCKAYCIREAGVHGSQHNQYAPFYVWHDSQAASDFLWNGGGFDGIVRDFGRPSVDTWIPVAAETGDVEAADVTGARLRTSSIPRHADLRAVAARLADRVTDSATAGGVHLVCAGVDPQRWQTVEFSMHEDTANSDSSDAEVLTVLHISQPD